MCKKNDRFNLEIETKQNEKKAKQYENTNKKKHKWNVFWIEYYFAIKSN